MERVAFVGVAASQTQTYQVLPKFFSLVENDSAKAKSMRLVVKALRKYERGLPRNHPDVGFLKASADTSGASMIALSDWLIRDYQEHGLYKKVERKHVWNGRGRIEWQKTIDRGTSYNSRGKPLHLDVITQATASDPALLVARLHRMAVEESQSGYGHLLGYSPISLDHEPVERLARVPTSSLVQRVLERELRLAYAERTIRLLKILRAWFGHFLESTSGQVDLYGVTSPPLFWEAVCGAVFRNEFNRWEKFIPSPAWTNKDGLEEKTRTLRPDIIRCFEGSTGRLLVLADAKYYTLQMPPGLNGNPGVNDVAKQLFYERVLKAHAIDQGYHEILNCFIFPSPDGDFLTYAGTASLEGLDAGPIAVVFMNAPMALEKYIFGETVTDEQIKVVFDECKAAA